MTVKRGIPNGRASSHGIHSVPGGLKVRRVRTREELQRAFAIRLRVFVREQGVPRDVELDRDDARAVHFLATMGGRAVGTARVVMNDGKAKIGRMAVLKGCRRKGIGRVLVRRALAWAEKRGVASIYLNAQVPVVGFYEKMSFRAVGGTFREAGIPHQKMILTTGPRTNRLSKRAVPGPVKKVPGARRAKSRRAKAYLSSTLKRGD